MGAGPLRASSGQIYTVASGLYLVHSPSYVCVSADILHQKMTETCASAHIGGVNIVLLEGITPDIQYVQLLFNFCLLEELF